MKYGVLVVLLLSCAAFAQNDAALRDAQARSLLSAQEAYPELKDANSQFFIVANRLAMEARNNPNSPLHAVYLSPDGAKCLADLAAVALGRPVVPARGQAAASAPVASGAPAPAAAAAVPENIEVPSVEIILGKSGSRISNSSDDYTTESQTDHLMRIDGKVHAFSPPRDGYIVQCFFIARDEADGNSFMFDAQQQKIGGQFAQFSFDAPPLAGTYKRSTIVPFTGSVTGTVTDGSGNSANVQGTYSGYSTTSDTITGSKFDGWVVRVVSGSKVLLIKSNQGRLETLARQYPAMLDKALMQKNKNRVGP